MKIVSLNIDGFGVFHRKDIEPISSGVTVFYGPNEAGKSTLMAFVKAVLYGFPSRGADQYYPPQVAGRHGGSVRIQNEDGLWTVERYSGKNALKLTRPDGQLGGADDLRRLLCFSTETVFKNIFSFGLTELQDFKTLSTDEIREKIFSGSISGTGPSARDALVRLERQANEILLPRGKSTRIAALMTEFKEIEIKIRDAKNLAQDYQSLIRQEESLLEEIQKLNFETDKIRREHGRIQLLLDLWPDWNQKKRLEDDIHRGGLGPVIPREVQLRVQQCLQKLDTEEQKRAEWVTDLEAERREIERNQPDVQLLDKQDKIRRLSQEVPLYRSNQERFRQLSTRLFEAEASVRDVLMDLGEGWEESKVMGLNVSIPAQEKVREMGQSLSSIQAELQELEQSDQSCADRIEELGRQIQDYERAIEESGVSAFPEDFAESEKLVRLVRSNFLEKKQLLERIEFLKNQMQERRHVLEDLQTEVDSHPIPFVTMPILSFLAAGSLIFAVWRGIRFDYIQASIAGVFGLIFTFLSIIIVRVQIRAKKKNEKDSHRLFEIQALNQKIENEISEATKKTLRLQELINEYSKKLGKEESVSEISDIDLIETEWLNQKTVAERNTEKRELLENARSNQSQLQSQKENLVAQIVSVRDQLIDLESKFSSWKSDAGLPISLSPQGVLEFYEKIRLIRERISQRDLVKNELKDTERSIKDWESHLVGLGLSDSKDPIEHLTALTTTLENEIRKRDTSLYRQTQARELEVKIESVERRIEALKIELNQIFSEVGVQDQYAFENQVVKSLALEKSREQLAEIELRFLNRLGSKHTLEKFIEEFESGSLESWQVRSEELESRLDQFQSRRDVSIGEAKAMSVERERLEKSSDLQVLELDRARVISELEQASLEWARLQCAKGLIEEALAVFEKEHQPKVLLQASQIFSKVTGEKYERIVQGDGAGEVVVIDSRGGRKENHQLSRGTAEQLYLALRLGLAHSFSLRQGALPILMDDVCVNFDPERTEQMIRAILDFGQKHQIFYFTCQPWVRDVFTKISPKVEVRELQGDNIKLTQSELWGEDLSNTQRS